MCFPCFRLQGNNIVVFALQLVNTKELHTKIYLYFYAHEHHNWFYVRGIRGRGNKGKVLNVSRKSWFRSYLVVVFLHKYKDDSYSSPIYLVD